MPRAPGGGVTFVYSFQNVWAQTGFFVYQDFYSKANGPLGESVAAQPGDDGIITTGYGLNGEVFSYSNDC